MSTLAVALGLGNLVLGLVYSCYGVLTVLDMRRGWRRDGFSHFGAAWIAMAFTCGPHHLHHAAHLLEGAHRPGALDLFAVVVGAPAGIIWFLLRLEAFVGGRGDRVLRGGAWTVRALPAAAVSYVVALVAGATTIVVRHHGPVHWNPQTTPNCLLVGAYLLTGAYVLQAQLDAHRRSGSWSVSGLALAVVFPTCAAMHAAWVLYAALGDYRTSAHGMLIDTLSVPAAAYFLAVVRSLLVGGPLRDWNRTTPVSEPLSEPLPA